MLLLAIARPNLRRAPAELAWLAIFGIELALMNVLFYEAIERIPLGVAVTVEFVGPLSVALLGSRRPRDVVWVVLAAAGITLFAGMPTGAGIDAAGLVFALLAGTAWACYIFTAQRVGRAWQGSQGLAAGMFASAVLLAPTGLGRMGSVSAGSGLTIVALGILSAALPFSLEMAALRRLTARTYGVLASLEPAIATGVGVVALGQHVRRNRGAGNAARGDGVGGHDDREPAVTQATATAGPSRRRVAAFAAAARVGGFVPLDGTPVRYAASAGNSVAEHD